MIKHDLPRTNLGTSAVYYASNKTKNLAVSTIRDGATKSLYHIPAADKEGTAQ